MEMNDSVFFELDMTPESPVETGGTLLDPQPFQKNLQGGPLGVL
jgi:hypothetical protein